MIAPAGSIVLEARGVSVARGARVVVRDVDLRVDAGERVAVVGGNGAGKTSLLRVLAGLAAPHAGEVRWLGAALPRGAGRVAVVGVLAQGEPPSELRVREMVALGLGLDAPALAHPAVAAALTRYHLDAVAERRCATLSGGEAQRVLLARATVAGPRLVVLDEPTTHLDVRAGAELTAWLARNDDDSDAAGRAVIIATHDLALAARCDRIVVLAGGRVVVDGGAAAVLASDALGEALGVRLRTVVDPAGGPPLLRVDARGTGLEHVAP